MIRADHLVKTYGEIQAVRDVPFNVDQGEIFAFLGPNGAGKTTTIKIFTTLLRPTSGKVEIDGLDPATHQNEVRRRFGIVFQDPSLDDELTACENMDLHGALYGRLSKSGSAQLHPVPRARGSRNEHSVYFDFLRYRTHLRPPVWIPQRDAGGAGPKTSDHDRPKAGRRDRSDYSGLIVVVICLVAGFRPNLTALPLMLYT